MTEEQLRIRLIRRVLCQALALIQGGWCQRDMAQDKHGRSVTWDYRHARAFCASGALHRAKIDVCRAIRFQPNLRALAMRYFINRDTHALVWSALYPTEIAPAGARLWRDLTSFNDAEGRSREEVIAAFERAIHALDEEGVCPPAVSGESKSATPSRIGSMLSGRPLTLSMDCHRSTTAFTSSTGTSSALKTKSRR